MTGSVFSLLLRTWVMQRCKWPISSSLELTEQYQKLLYHLYVQLIFMARTRFISMEGPCQLLQRVPHPLSPPLPWTDDHQQLPANIQANKYANISSQLHKLHSVYLWTTISYCIDILGDSTSGCLLPEYSEDQTPKWSQMIAHSPYQNYCDYLSSYRQRTLTVI